MNEKLFQVIRKYGKYCSRCGKKLDLTYKDWHLPFCMKYREYIWKREIKSELKKP